MEPLKGLGACKYIRDAYDRLGSREECYGSNESARATSTDRVSFVQEIIFFFVLTFHFLKILNFSAQSLYSTVYPRFGRKNSTIHVYPSTWTKTLYSGEKRKVGLIYNTQFICGGVM